MKRSRRVNRTDAEIIYMNLGKGEHNADGDIEIIEDALNLRRNESLEEAAAALEDTKYLGDCDAHMQMWNANVVVLQKKIRGLKWR